ncbi:bestrophin family protein [Leptospira sarikeiensis]|uniref:Multidrug transporter n=1 Tax=Leptospira sarikeiensis TaxID=2484943 RepID=A0A4R9JZK7_9LEPT|nr:bestrophin family ion channel [Leptospira sarikeiensis]TGL57695.1 multidrug transporter [Leptospira sarikeiensis]
MHVGKRYHLFEFLLWTRRDIYILLLLSIVPTCLFQALGYKWIAIPWVPVALVGTAAAFIVGFKNTQSYNRVWEARQIWGSIVNNSRSFGMMVRDFIKADKEVHKELIYRHLAWLTCLRFQLRESKIWETANSKSHNKEYRLHYNVLEWETKLDDELLKFISAKELGLIQTRKNKASQLLYIQSQRIKELKDKKKIDPLEFLELNKKITDLFEQQGKSERIKNFPYPRQFASINQFFIWLFVFLLPFGMLNEFQKLGENFVWLTIPFSILVSWVFTSMEKVGEATENPFEGGANDVPITSLSRVIEIDLRELLNEKDIPAPLAPVNNILM